MWDRISKVYFLLTSAESLIFDQTPHTHTHTPRPVVCAMCVCVCVILGFIYCCVKTPIKMMLTGLTGVNKLRGGRGSGGRGGSMKVRAVGESVLFTESWGQRRAAATTTGRFSSSTRNCFSVCVLVVVALPVKWCLSNRFVQRCWTISGWNLRNRFKMSLLF